ncbi:MAG: GNAT family N-acetyltransferase [Clostridia bacterium]|nr:GNAT family N-acetyltransferase [Clostridia bacterium]
MEIRHATPADLSRVMEIYAEGRAYMRENGNHEQWNGAYPSEEIVREDLAADRFYVVCEGEEIFGVFCYFFGDDPTYAKIDGAWLNDAPYGVIHRIAVGANAHRRGIASRCFAFGYERCGNLKIDTHRDNFPMQRSLEKNGFRYCGVIYLENGDPRMAYQKCEEAVAFACVSPLDIDFDGP